MKTTRMCVVGLVMMLAITVAQGQTIAITGFSPTSGPVGTTVTISGTGFNASASNNLVYFGGVLVAPSGGGATSLTVNVPAGATFGLISVTDTVNGRTAYSPSPFAVTFNAIRQIDASFLAPKVDFSTGASTTPRGVAVADIDRDGKLDVLVAATGTGYLNVYRNVGQSGAIGSSTLNTTPAQVLMGTRPYGVAVADIDGDGKLDAIVTDTSGTSVYVARNTSTVGTISFAGATSFTVGTNPRGVAVADLEGDGKPDVVTANKGSNNISILRNTSTISSISFAAKTDFAVSTAPVDVAIGDVDNNGDYEPDIVAANSGVSSITVLQNNGWPGSISFSIAVTPASSANPTGVFVSDVDGDGLNDIVTAGSTTSKVSVIRNATNFGSSIAFAAKVDFEAGNGPFDVIAGDLDGDGKPEVIASRQSVDSVSVLKNNASIGVITSSSLLSYVAYRVGAGPALVAMGDLDRDSKSDVIVSNAGSNTFSVLRNSAVKRETEPNSNRSQANIVSIGETIDGTISLGDVDYYLFYAAANDTVSFYGDRVPPSELSMGIEIYDSLGNYWNYPWSWRDFPSDQSVHFVKYFPQSGWYYVRFVWNNDSSGFPTKRPDDGEVSLVQPGGAAGVASSDTGGYRLRLERFVPTAPEFSPWAGYYDLNSNSAGLGGTFIPMGLTTTVTLEYGVTPGLGSSVPVPGSFTGIEQNSPQVTLSGLQPNTLYYFRFVATNAVGPASSQTSTVKTPPAPEGWVRQSIGSSTYLYDVSFSSQSTGYIAGGNGIVLKTTNGGTTWTNTSPPWGYYSGVWASGGNATVVGGGGAIQKTTDGGSTWISPTTNPAAEGLNEVAFFTSLVGIAVGDNGRIIRTTDGGSNWESVRYGASHLYGLTISSVNNAYAVGASGTILRTTTQGATWDTLSSGTTSWLYGIDFTDVNTGFAVGENYQILKTADGGNTWTSTQFFLPYSAYSEVAFVDGNNGIIVGAGGQILRTTNAGSTWTLQQSGTRNWIRGVAFVGRSATAVGDNGVVLNFLDPTDEIEDNGTSGTAQSIVYRDAVDASIFPAGDVDFYKFDALAADTVEVYVTSYDTVVVNGFLELLGTDGSTVLTSNDDFVAGDSIQSRIVAVLPGPGTYFIRYTSSSNATTGNYRIRLLDINSLRPIVPFAGVATIVSTFDVILKAPVVPNNLATTINFEYGPTTSYGLTVPADQNGTGGQQLINATKTVTGLTPFQEYHFRLVAENAAGPPIYGPDAMFTMALGTTRTETESNDLITSANTIFIGDTVNGAISPGSDIDYYRFQAAAGDTLEVYAYPRGISQLDTYMYITDSLNTWGIDIYRLPNSRTPHAVFVAPNTGIYHIRYQRNSGNLGDYGFRLMRFSPSGPDARSNVAGVFSTSAIIRVEVAPNGLSTTVNLEYGTSPSLGLVASATTGPVNGIAIQTVPFSLNGLFSGSPYYIRVMAYNSLDTSYSALNSFTTADQSEKWTRQESGQLDDVADVAFVSDSVGYAVAGSQILRTTNAGSTWSSQQNPTWYAYSLGFGNKDTGVTMYWGSISRTTNGGLNWSYVPTTFYGYSGAVRFANSALGMAVGYAYNSSTGSYPGTIARTTDAGATWTLVRNEGVQLNDVAFTNADTAFVVGQQGVIYRTYNFTSPIPAWDSLSSGTSASLNGIWFVDKDTGIAVGGNTMRRTTNGGATWSSLTVPGLSSSNALAFRNSLIGILVEGDGQIFRTTNAGATWTEEKSGTRNNLRSVSYSGRVATVVGNYGTILRSIDPFGELEPNNTNLEAQLLAYNEQVAGGIQPSTDVDYYKFSTGASDTVEVLVQNTSFNGKVELLNSVLTVQASNDDYIPGDTSKSRVVFALPGAGQYYIRVTPSTSASTGSYIVGLRKITPKPLIAARGYANLTPTGVTLSATVDPNNISTTVNFKWGTTGNFNNLTPAVPPSISGQQRQTVTANLSLSPFQEYNFKVVVSNAVGSDSSASQNFFAPRATALAEIESNDTTLNAQQLAFGDSVNGVIVPNTDVDYYKIRVASTDTLEVFASRRGVSELYTRIEIYDSTTNQSRWSNNFLPTSASPHQIDYPGTSTTLYVRVKSANDYNTSFPGIVGDPEVPQPLLPLPGMKAQAATTDTGEYRLYVRRFLPSAPDAQDHIGYGSIFYDSMGVQTTIAPNGLSTTVSFEYGPTTSYGNPVPSIGGPFTGIGRNGVTAQIGGLQGGMTYYVRSIVSNSAGTSYGGGNTITMPPSPEGWGRRKYGTTNVIFRDVDFVSESVGYIASSNNLILKTTDGGLNWVSQTSPIGTNYQSVSFSDASIGTMVGYSGRIIRTTNGGTTWTQQTSGTTTAFFRTVRMLGPDTVVVVGYDGTGAALIWRTMNGGANWGAVTPGTTNALNGLAFSPQRDTGYAVGGSGTVLRTTNKGVSWEVIQTFGSSLTLLSAWFKDGRNGFVVGGNMTIHRTTDAGATWTQTYLSTPGGYYLYDIAFTDQNIGLVVGDFGQIFRTYDGGATWSAQQSGTYNTLAAADFSGRRATTVGVSSTILTAVGLLANPTNLQATYASPNVVNVTWNDNATGEGGYLLERKTGASGTFAQLGGALAQNTSSASDVVEQGRIYYYRVRAFTEGVDTSAYSTEDSALVPLAVPSGLTATTISSSQINLSWSNVADARTGYKIERKTVGGSYAEIAAIGDVNAYQNTGLTSGTGYIYRIRSYNADMNSDYSVEDTASSALGRPTSISISPGGWTNSDWFEISWTAPTNAMKAWYTVDTPPTAVLTGTEADLIDATSFGFTLPAAGDHWVYFYLADSSGNKDYVTYDSVQAQWDNVSPQISHNNGLVSLVTYLNGNITSNPVSIDASVTKSGGFTPLVGATLEFKKTNESTINVLNYPAASGGSLSIPNVTFLTNAKPNGVDYRITASDQAGNYVETQWYSVPVQVGNSTSSDFVPPSAGTSDDANTLVTGYRIFSVPFDLSDKKPQSFMESTTTGLGPHAKEGVNYYNWRMQRFESGTRQDYEEFKAADAIAPGKAFFLVTRAGKTITVGAGSLVKAQDMFGTGVAVVSGWNLVGNPFPDDLPAESLFVAGGTIQAKAYYTGNGPQTGWVVDTGAARTLRKWEGLAVRVDQNTFLRFKAVPPATNQKDVPPPPAVVSAQAALNRQEGNGWLVRLSAYRRDNDQMDAGNTIGMVPNAKTGYDPYDSFQPPILLGKNVALYFSNPEGAMSNDIRPLNAEGQSWEMKVMTGDRAARIRVNIEQVVAIADPSTRSFLLDQDEHMAHDLSKQREIEFNSKEGLRTFRVVVGTKNYVDSVSASLGIDLVPRTMTLYQNYPNPFNPETAVRFTIPGMLPSYRVTLKIYNIIGQEVVSLIDRDMVGGYYETVFNARNYASGTYIYRLIVSGGTSETTYSDVKKMMLIK